MFDRCWLWRRKLTRRADGTLSRAQWGALENHLAHCQRCQEATLADQALHSVLGTHTGLLDARSARALDDHVVSTLFPAQTASAGAGPYRPQPTRPRPFVYLIQIMGSAIAAAAVTALFLVPALHPGAATLHDERNPMAMERSEPPVPLGSLLQTTSPRAALLWTHPDSTHSRTPAPPPPMAQPSLLEFDSSPTRRRPAVRQPMKHGEHSMSDIPETLGS